MLCTFCGTENRPENKFCGMCGVRLERRQLERRVRQDSLKCPSCGQLNELGLKFCTMCGSRVDRRVRERRPAATEEPRATAMANAQLPTPEALGRASAVATAQAAAAKPEATQPSPPSDVPAHPKTPPAIFRNEPSRTAPIGGPSFLGLGDEPQDSSEYLLDDEGSSGGVLRKLVLIAILVAVGGLVFVAWRSSSLANTYLFPGAKHKPATSPSPQVKSQDAAPEATPASKVSDLSPVTGAASDAKTAPRLAAKDETPSSGAATAATDEQTADSGADKTAAATGKASRLSPEAVPPGQRKPSALLLRAQQYLQGRGVTQNCEQGLMYLRAATQKNDPAAAVQMGALYASGHCVPRDQVTAYRWFNSAHELDPANPWIQTNLDQLWAQMTPQERQRVGQ